MVIIRVVILFFKEAAAVLVDTYNQWLDDKALKMAAALSFYTIFSLSPVLVIVIAVVGSIFGRQAVRGEIVGQIGDLLGRDGAKVVQSVIRNASVETSGIFPTILGVGVMILASVIVFLELKESLNIIWGIEMRPGRPIRNLIKNRLISFAMVIGSGVLLLVSIIISAVLSGLRQFLLDVIPRFVPLLQWINWMVSILMVTLVFALIFKYIPDARIEWKYIWIGSIVTSALFLLGKFIIGLYLGSSSYQSVYGTAGSLVVVLIWIYYTALIFFWGAEFTQVIRNRYGRSPLEPSANAIVVPKTTRIIERTVKGKKT